MNGLFSGTEAPWIGLGCGAFGGSCGASEAMRVLDASYAAGIRHLDTANSYGFGGSEKIIGDWLKRIDVDTVTIATKFGKRVERQSGLKLWARRTLGGVAKSLRRRVSKTSASLSVCESDRKTVERINARDLESSVHQSLRSLGIEQLSVLHLHSASPESLSEEVQDALATILETGKVRVIGLATNRSDCESLIQRGFPAGVVQFPDSPCWNHPIRWPEVSPQTVVTHSVLGRDGARRAALAEWLNRNEVETTEWSERLGLDAASREGCSELLLRAAMARNPSGGVLCGASRVVQVEMMRRVIESRWSDDRNHELLKVFGRISAELAA